MKKVLLLNLCCLLLATMAFIVVYRSAPGQPAESKKAKTVVGRWERTFPKGVWIWDIRADGTFSVSLKEKAFATTHPRRPGEAITREQAVIAYTRTAAYAEFAEQTKGTLTVGKVADLAVLSQNIFKAPIPKLLQTESVLTMVNGVVVYDAGLLTISR